MPDRTPRRLAAATAVAAMALLALPRGARSHAQPPAGCAAAEHRQFDFWVGEWDVYNPAGRLAGRNSVTLEMGRCVVHEHWTGGGGNVGESFNVYDARSRRWHQTWVDNGGTLLLLDGGLAGDTMTLRNVSNDSAGKRTEHVIRYYRVGGAPDTLRQLWQASDDGGATWKTVFDGKYVRRAR